MESRDDINFVYEVRGDKDQYIDQVERMWTEGRYPDQTSVHYVVSYDIDFDSDNQRGSVTLVDIPGEDIRNLLNSSPSEPLVERLRRGTIDLAAGEDYYKGNIQRDFERGTLSADREGKEQFFLFHYSDASKVPCFAAGLR